MWYGTIGYGTLVISGKNGLPTVFQKQRSILFYYLFKFKFKTLASIPDYRGPNGLWTLLEKGVKVDLPDFSLVEPTYSHMALKAMMDMKLIEHVVSQNCGN